MKKKIIKKILTDKKMRKAATLSSFALVVVPGSPWA